ncbi:hypothetical protein GOODEAATRI_016538, partial [Goodea atripinnis]
EGLALKGQCPERGLPRERSVEEAGNLGLVEALVMRDEDIKEVLAALKMVCRKKALTTGRPGQRILTGSQKRLGVKPKTGTGTRASVVVQNGKTSAGVVETRENHVDGGFVEGLTVVEAQGGAVVTAASTTNRKKPLTLAGSPETISQVQATIQGMTPIAASMKIEEAAGRKSQSQETPRWTGQAGPQHPAGL